MILTLDATVDFVFRKVFGHVRNKRILIALINAVLRPRPDRRIVDVEILNPFNLADFQGDKTSVVDIKARDASGRILIIEMQIAAWREILKRHLFYLTENYAGQIKDGEPYHLLHPVVLIAFHVEPPFPASPEFHLSFQLRDEKTGMAFTDDLSLHIIQLSKLRSEIPSDPTPLELWAWLLMNAERLDTEQIPEALTHEPQIVDAIREMEMIARNEQEKLAYEARKKHQRDEIARERHYQFLGEEIGQQRGIAIGEERGIAIGEERGIAIGAAIGEQRGVLRGRISLLQEILGMPPTSPDELQRKSLEELQELVTDLERARNVGGSTTATP